MATGGKGALSLLQNYSSDSEGDSGYTSEDDKKRKQDFRNPHERKRKKRRGEEEEDMMVDTPSAASSRHSAVQSHIDTLISHSTTPHLTSPTRQV